MQCGELLTCILIHQLCKLANDLRLLAGRGTRADSVRAFLLQGSRSRAGGTHFLEFVPAKFLELRADLVS